MNVEFLNVDTPNLKVTMIIVFSDVFLGPTFFSGENLLGHMFFYRQNRKKKTYKSFLS
jgi:hypothetical protein